MLYVTVVKEMKKYDPINVLVNALANTLQLYQHTTDTLPMHQPTLNQSSADTLPMCQPTYYPGG